MRKTGQIRRAAVVLALAVLCGSFAGCTEEPSAVPTPSPSIPTLRPAEEIPEGNPGPAVDPPEDYDSLPDFSTDPDGSGFLITSNYSGVSSQSMDDYLAKMEAAGYRVLRGTGIWLGYADEARLLYSGREILFFGTADASSGQWYLKRFRAERTDGALTRTLQALLPDDQVICALDLTQEEVYLQTGLRRVICVTAGYGQPYLAKFDYSAPKPPDFSLFPAVVGPNGLLTEPYLSGTDLDCQFSADLDGDGTTEFVTMAYPFTADARPFSILAYDLEQGIPVLRSDSCFMMRDYSTPFPGLENRGGRVCLDGAPLQLDGMRLTPEAASSPESPYSPYGASLLIPQKGMQFAALREAEADRSIWSSYDGLIVDLSEWIHPAPYLAAAFSDNGVSVTGLVTISGDRVWADGVVLCQTPGNLSALLQLSRDALTAEMGPPHFHWSDYGAQLCWFTGNGLLLRVTMENDPSTVGTSVYADLYDPADGEIKQQAWVNGYAPDEHGTP